jgi:hypothetical protein
MLLIVYICHPKEYYIIHSSPSTYHAAHTSAILQIRTSYNPHPLHTRLFIHLPSESTSNIRGIHLVWLYCIVHISSSDERAHRSLFHLWYYPQRRLGSIRVPGHAFFAGCSSWRMVVYICYITAPGPLSSSCQDNWYGTEKVGSTAGPSRKKSHLPGHFPSASQAAAVLGQPSSFGLIDTTCHWTCK